MVVDGRLDGFAEAEASVMNAMNGTDRLQCRDHAPTEQGFLKKVGATKRLAEG